MDGRRANGMGSGGAVMMIDGIPSTSVRTANEAMEALNGRGAVRVSCNCNWLVGTVV